MSALPYEHLSFSQLNQFGGYGGCELAWFYKNIAKIPPKPKGTPLLAGIAWDDATTLGANHKIDTGAEPDGDLLGEAFLDKWKEEQDSGEYEEPSESSYILDRGIKAARAFAQDVLPQVNPVATQVRVGLEFEEVDWTLVGYVDLLELADNGTLVTDNKATAGSTKYDAAKAANDLQLGLYDVALTSTGQGIVGRGFRSVRLLKTKTEFGSAHVASSDDQRAMTLDILGLLAGRMESACQTGDFLPTGFLSGSWKCSARFCDAWEICAYGAKARVSVPITTGVEAA